MIDKKIIECKPPGEKSRGKKSGIDMIQCGYVNKKGQKDDYRRSYSLGLPRWVDRLSGCHQGR